MSDKRQQAAEIIRQMLTPQNVEGMEGTPREGMFAPEIGRMALENVYEPLWTRPGLSLQQRSLLTLGILIGLKNENELRVHFAAAMRNGLTREQLEEVLYHATAYAGFPAASSARAVAAQVFETDSPETSA